MLSGGGDLQLIVRENKNIVVDDQWQERNATGRYRDRQRKKETRRGSLTRAEYRLALSRAGGAMPKEENRITEHLFRVKKGDRDGSVDKIRPHKHGDQSPHPASV